MVQNKRLYDDQTTISLCETTMKCQGWLSSWFQKPVERPVMTKTRVRILMKKLLIAVLLLLPGLSALAQPAGFEVEYVAVHYGQVGNTDLNGYVTYRIYIPMTNANDFMSGIYGNSLNPGDPFAFTPDTEDFSIQSPCGCFDDNVFGGFLGNTMPATAPSILPEAAFDTYWTINMTSSADPGSLQIAVTVSDPNPIGATSPCATVVDDGFIFTLAGQPNGLPDADQRVLIAQVTTCSDEWEIEYCLQTFIQGNQNDQDFFCTEQPIVVENPCVANPLLTDLTVIEDVLCFGQTATVEVAGGGNGNVTFELFEVGGQDPLATQQGDNVFENIGAGDFVIALVDEVGCRDTTEVFSFVEPPLFDVTVTQVSDNECGGGSAESEFCLEIEGGVPPFTIEAEGPTGIITTINEGECFLGLTCVDNNGDYTIRVTDSNGCLFEEAVTVSCPSTLEFQTTITNNFCAGESEGELFIEVTDGNGNTTIVADIPGFDGFSANAPFETTITGIPAGVYLIEVTDANNCTATEIVEFVDPPAFDVEISAQDMLCAGECTGQVVWEAVGGTQPYTLTVINLAGTELDPNTLCAGTYTAIVTDANGCNVAQELVIGEPDPIIFTFEVADVSCNGDSDGAICVTTAEGGTGALQWQISAPANATTPFGTEECFIGLTPGDYELTFQDESGCVVSQSGITVGEPGPLAVVLTTTNVSCNGFNDGEIVVSFSGGTGVVQLVEPALGQLPVTLTNLAPGEQLFLIQDETGCEAAGSATITEPALLTVEVLSVTEISCGGECTGSVELLIEGGTGSTDIFLNGEPSGTNNLCANDYELLVVDANGCEVTDFFTVIAPEPIEFLLNVNNVTCTGMNDGSVNIFPTGGVGQIVFEIEGDVDQNNLFEGEYFVSGVDETGCVADTSFIVGADITTDMELTLFSSPVTCWNESDGTATVAVTGGNQPITYQWNDLSNQTTATAVGLSEDTYTVVVTDVIGCTLSEIVEVEPTEGCFFIATAVTPNGDGFNDDWVIGGLEFFPNSMVQVYNRWGQLMFESRGYATRWDATWNGRRVPIADYYFVITYDENEEPITGTVTVKY